MSSPVRTQKLLWHLTDINNIESIFKYGLLSRECILASDNNFSDIAASDIIDKRKEQNLLNYIPFHFFVNNPFDGRVLNENSDKDFCYISIYRTFAENSNFEILTKHPLSEDAELLSYNQGFDKIDWNKLELRDYSDSECKSICMAEALSPNTITYQDFFSIVVYNEKCEKIVRNIADEVIGVGGYNFHIDVCPSYFSARKLN